MRAVIPTRARIEVLLRHGSGVMLLLPPFGHFFLLWLGVTRASDPPVPCGHRLSFRSAVLAFSMLIRKGMVSYDAAPKKIAERVFCQ